MKSQKRVEFSEFTGTQAYVVRCKRAVSAPEVGLGLGTYKPGMYVSKSGSPTGSLKRAHIYSGMKYEINAFLFDAPVGDSEVLRMYFEKVPVTVKTTVAIK